MTRFQQAGGVVGAGQHVEQGVTGPEAGCDTNQHARLAGFVPAMVPSLLPAPCTRAVSLSP